jgi:hypothetical protein
MRASAAARASSLSPPAERLGSLDSRPPMDSRFALLLTATVAPSASTPYLNIRDPRRREAHYLEALARWCKALPANWEIVVAENSGWPASRFTDVAERLGRAVHILECADRGSRSGKGVGEAGLLDDFAASGLAGTCDWIFKCTGRLSVDNIATCLPQLDGDGVCASILPSLTYMDSRFFGASREVFEEYFTGMGADIREDDVVYLEHVAARRMLSAIGAGHAFHPFPKIPYVVGHSASLGKSYNGASSRIKWFLRNRVRRIVIDREILI